jgi:hypothetical protein
MFNNNFKQVWPLLTVLKIRFGFCVILLWILTKEPGQLKPFDFTLILYIAVGPSSALMARVLGADTLLYSISLYNAQFYFPLPSLLLHKSHRCKYPCSPQQYSW